MSPCLCEFLLTALYIYSNIIIMVVVYYSHVARPLLSVGIYHLQCKHPANKGLR